MVMLFTIYFYYITKNNPPECEELSISVSNIIPFQMREVREFPFVPNGIYFIVHVICDLEIYTRNLFSCTNIRTITQMKVIVHIQETF